MAAEQPNVDVVRQNILEEVRRLKATHGEDRLHAASFDEKSPVVLAATVFMACEQAVRCNKAVDITIDRLDHLCFSDMKSAMSHATEGQPAEPFVAAKAAVEQAFFALSILKAGMAHMLRALKSLETDDAKHHLTVIMEMCKENGIVTVFE